MILIAAIIVESLWDWWPWRACCVAVRMWLFSVQFRVDSFASLTALPNVSLTVWAFCFYYFFYYHCKFILFPLFSHKYALLMCFSMLLVLAINMHFLQWVRKWKQLKGVSISSAWCLTSIKGPQTKLPHPTLAICWTSSPHPHIVFHSIQPPHPWPTSPPFTLHFTHTICQSPIIHALPVTKPPWAIPS